MALVSLVVCLSLLLMCGGPTASDKLLVVPLDGSHWLSMRDVVEELGPRGHQIIVLVPEFSLLIRPSQHYMLRTYPVPYTQEQLDQRMKFISTHYFDERSWHEKFMAGTMEYQIVIYLTSVFYDGCKSLLKNSDLIRSLEEDSFDALFTDPALPCGVILAERLGVPSVHLFRGYPCGLEYVATHSPSPMSYIPRCYTTNSDHMSFSERIQNFIFSYLELLLFKSIYTHYERLAASVLQRDVNIMELLGRASVWLLRYDFVFEHARPVMPNMAFIGGVNCIEGRKLNQKQCGWRIQSLQKNSVTVQVMSNRNEGNENISLFNRKISNTMTKYTCHLARILQDVKKLFKDHRKRTQHCPGCTCVIKTTKDSSNV